MRQNQVQILVNLFKKYFTHGLIGFAVTQALVNILATHGGCSLMDLPKEEVCLSPPNDRFRVGPLTLANALSAYILSNR